MCIELFLCLWLAHLVADFVLQTSDSCSSKAESHWRSIHQYIHAGIVFALSWLVSFDLRFWWCALIIGALHLCIDVWKSYRKEDVIWFSLDQLLHLLVLIGVAWLWTSMYEWHIPFGVETWWIAAAVVVLICWKPSNIFIKLTLKHYSVNMPQEKEGGFNAGALLSIFIAVLAGLGVMMVKKI